MHIVLVLFTRIVSHVLYSGGREGEEDGNNAKYGEAVPGAGGGEGVAMGRRRLEHQPLPTFLWSHLKIKPDRFFSIRPSPPRLQLLRPPNSSTAYRIIICLDIIILNTTLDKMIVAGNTFK